MRIRYLPETLINQIAAGEVVERPAAAVKEIVENSIDAGATQVNVTIRDGGKSLIIVSDNGSGMNKEDLIAAFDRHATSKLTGNDLLNIQYMGFRGEALPSIAAVARVKITTCMQDNEAWELQVDGGKKGEAIPCAHTLGTQVEVRDLFYATPARLKFLKSERAEYMAVKDTITRLSMANPNISFTLAHNGKTSLKLPALLDSRERLSSILGKEFGDNSIEINSEREGIKLSGYAGLPTLNRATSQHQYLFVNGRPVRDKLLHGCVRAAYFDVLHTGRHPMLALFLTLSGEEVDINVHPAKTEVRFRDPGLVRGLIISSLKHALHEGGFQSSSSISTSALGAMRPSGFPNSKSLPIARGNSQAVPHSYIRDKNGEYGNLAEAQHREYTTQMDMNADIMPSARNENFIQNTPENENFPLGAARAQLHENYIVAQTKNGIVIVDQHAAHERLTYERFKAQMSECGIEKQGLLTPEIIELDEGQIELLLKHRDALSTLGLEIESFGAGAIAVQSIPAILADKTNIKHLVCDLADDILESDNVQNIEKQINNILSSMACHGSIRSGRRMNADEMNYLLREMEETPYSGQCNHGRPTYIELNLNDIEKLFGRR